MALDASPAQLPAVAEPPTPKPPKENDQHRLLLRWSDITKTPNIAQEIKDDWENGESVLQEIGFRVLEEYQTDNNTRSEWLDASKAAMDLAMQTTKTKTTPWVGASNVIYPLITVGAIQFASRAYPGIVQNKNVVKGDVVGNDQGVPQVDPATGQPVMGPDGKPQFAPGKDGQPQMPGAKRARADKIGQHMSWQLLEENDEWEAETDKLLHILPIVGCVFRKTYFDPVHGCNRSPIVPAENVVINFWAKSMAMAPRITEELKLYPVEIEELIRAGIFLDQEYAEPLSAGGDRDAPREFLEQHRRWDLDGDDYPEPYVVTVEKQTGKVARIIARFDPDGVIFSKNDNRVQKITAVEYYTKYDFMPNPRGGIYGVGFGQVLRPLNESINTAINQLFDAGSLQNTGGGFIGRGLSLNSGQVKFKLGEWKVVNSAGNDIKSAIVPFAHPGPAPVLFQLLGLLVEAGKDISAVKDVLAGEQPQPNMPATSLLALIEQGLKVFTSIWKRIRRSMKQEYDKLYRLNRLYLEEEASYRVGDEWKSIKRQDYMLGSGVVPYADETMVTDMQKLGRANILQMFANDPLFNGMEIRRRMLQAANIEGTEALLSPDPMSNPMLFFKRAELGVKEMEAKAMALYHMARGVQALAMGDKAIGDVHLDWMASQFDMLQRDLMNLNTMNPPRPDQPQPQDPLMQPPQPPAGGDPPGVGQGKVNLGAGFGGGS